jgi:hypothetical protein
MSSKLIRPNNSRQAKFEIIIVCEGKRTEPEYFNAFKKELRKSLVKVTPIGGCGVPPSVVERAIQMKQEKSLEARRSRDSFDKNFEVWAVFDRDAHPGNQVTDAMTMAARNGINVAYSNPCFEVWGLMHFSIYNKPGHHHGTQADLKRVLTGYCHQNNPVMDLSLLMPRYFDAVKNAELALLRRSEEGREMGDPSTGVHVLTERIRTAA